MNRSSILYFSLGVGVFGSVLVSAVASPSASAFVEGPRPDHDSVERGRYLVHNVGLCIDCHSPRDEQGAFVEGKHLTGSPLPFAPTVAMPWAQVAPPIAGLPVGFTKEDTVRFLMTGERPNGRPAPLPPMPPYRFDRDDAEAVASYLQSLAVGTL